MTNNNTLTTMLPGIFIVTMVAIPTVGDPYKLPLRCCLFHINHFLFNIVAVFIFPFTGHLLGMSDYRTQEALILFYFASKK